MSEVNEPSGLPEIYIATDRVELSGNSSRHVRGCAFMTSPRPLEKCESQVGSDDIRDKDRVYRMRYAVFGEKGEPGNESCSPYFT